MMRKEDLPALLIGVTATFAGIGVARFAYTPLMPELVLQQWFCESEVAYLGASNLLGYLIGALSAHRLSERIQLRWLMGLCFAAIALSFALCAQPGDFGWFFGWRLIAGITGAILMVVGPATALASTRQAHRTRVGAFVFTGIGLGAVLAASVVPLLTQVSLSATWLALGAFLVLAGIVCDRSLVGLSKASAPVVDAPSNSVKGFGGVGLAVLCVLVAYALDAVGFIPHTVFWVDYLAREKALGTEAASAQWAIFGIGAACGPAVAGWVAQRLGWKVSLTLAFVAKAIAVALPLISVSLVNRSLSSFIVGALVPGIVALTSGRVAELVGLAEHKRYWGLATVVFAVAQTLSGYGMSALYKEWGSYYFLFYTGSVVLALGAFLTAFSDFLYKLRVHTRSPEIENL